VDVRLRASFARQNAELFSRFTVRGVHFEQPRTRCRWCLHEQRVPESLKSLGWPLRVDFDLAAGVSHPAGELEEVGKAIDERPEAHALYPAADAPPLRSGCGCSG
jgi:hypothetical protein